MFKFKYKQFKQNSWSKKAAFTLIELMAVVIILGIITTITVTSINYIISESKNRLYQEQIKRLELGVRKWALENTNVLPEGTGIAFFDVSRLKSEGIIDAETVVDPRNDDELKGCMVIRYDSNFEQYDYIYEDKNCKDVEGTYLPIITVTDGSSQHAEVCSPFDFPTVSSVTYDGKPIETFGPIIKKEGTVVTSINTGTVGDVYTLEYTATDPVLGLNAIRTITVTVGDTIAPIIVIDDINVSTSYSVTVEAGGTFVIPSAQIGDNSYCAGTYIPSAVLNDYVDITITGTLLSRIPGNYNITYAATDKSGNSRYLVLTVTIVDTMAPTAPTQGSLIYRLNSSAGATYTPNTWTNQNVWLGGISSIDEGSGVKNYAYLIVDLDPNKSLSDALSEVTCTGSYQNLANGVDNFVVSREGYYTICLIAYDQGNLVSSATKSNAIRIDKNPIVVNFSLDGSTTWARTRQTTVTVSDAISGVNTSTLRHLWTTSSTQPADALFTTTFTNGATLTSPSGVTGAYYLWIRGSDVTGNGPTYVRSNVFNLDNTAPVITVSGANPYEITVGSSFVEPGRSATDNTGVAPTITTSTIPSTATSGSHTITYTATDAAGNSSTATRQFYVWTAWSAWSTTVETATSTKQVETKTQYRFRDYVVTSTTYNSCQNSACGCGTWNSCQHSDCGQTCTNNTCRTSACGCQTWRSCQASACGIAYVRYCCPEGDCYVNQITCANGSTSVRVEVYNTCRTSACGCETWNLCQHSNCGTTCTTNTCRTSACGCQTWNSCRTPACGIESQTFDWTAWSAWQDTAVTASGTREVQTQTVYRFRTR
jgi:prepilin-type N-terminal cleavage/methylation domain-containing protein